MNVPVGDDDGLDLALRAIFASYVREMVGPVPVTRVAAALNETEDVTESRLRGTIPFSRAQLRAIMRLLRETPDHAVKTTEPYDPEHLFKVQQKLLTNPTEMLPELTTGEVAATTGRAVAERNYDRDLNESRADGVPGRIFEILTDPQKGRVALPAIVFCIVVSLPLLPHLGSVAKATSLTRIQLVLLGSATWTALNVLGLDVAMQWVLRNLLRMQYHLKKAYADLDQTITDRLGSLENPRVRATPYLSVRADRDRYNLWLSKAETCERIAVWLVLAVVPTAYLLVSMYSDYWLIYPAVLLVVAATLIGSAVDNVHRSRVQFRESSLRQ